MFAFWKRPGAVRNLTTYVVFGGIIIVFIFLGDVGLLGPMGTGYAVRVNHQVITVSQYRQAYQRMVDFYSQYMGADFDIKRQRQLGIHQQVLAELINMAVVYQEAYRMGMRTTDAEIKDVILSIDSFKEDGVFRREYYDRWLESQRKSPIHFEKELKQQILFQKIEQIFKDSLVLSSLEKEKKQMAQSIKLKMDYVQLKGVADVLDQEVSDYLSTTEGQQDVVAHYRENLSEYAEENSLLEVKSDDLSEKKSLTQSTPSEDLKVLIAEKLLKERKRREVKEVFNQALAEGDKKQINQLLNRYKGQWKTSKELSISDSVSPIFGPLGPIFEVILPLKKKGQIAGSLVDIDGQLYLFRRHSFWTVKKEKPSSFDRSSLQRFRLLFNQWSEELVSVADIDRNPSLLENN